MEKPLRIRGLAMTTGMSRNFNIYTPEELQAFASKLAEVVEVGAGGIQKTRLFLILGDLAVQLTGD
jgi:hypothetical protein